MGAKKDEVLKKLATKRTYIQNQALGNRIRKDASENLTLTGYIEAKTR